MTDREKFKAALLQGCLDRGMTPQQIHDFVKSASVLSLLGGAIEAGGRTASKIIPPVLGLGALATIGAPMAVGAAGGYGLAQLTEDDTDIDRVKADEIIAEYQRMTDQARRQAKLKKLHGLRTLGESFRT